MILCTRKTY